MAMKTEEAAQLSHVESDLMRRYADLPKRVVRLEVQQALGEFTAARVRTFVPVMVAKKASEALRRHQGSFPA